MEEDKPVRRVGDYEFLDRMAIGGMGELWRVRHVTLGAIYVAKQLRPEYREDTEFLNRFLHEAKLVANLRHPNIVQIFGYDEEHTLYLMEYIEGMDLDRLMRTGRQLTFAEKRTVIEVVADTIGYAHGEFDIIHRDIKPSNVLIEMANVDDPIQRSGVKLTDFGIARVLSVDQRITMQSGMVIGTVHYMAPEQFEGEAQKYSDVYSIGVLYYQLLVGSLPFDGPTAFVIRDRHLNDVPPAPHEIDPEIPLEDSMIVMKCLEKDPAKRFQDGAELYEAFAGTRPTTHTVLIPHRRRKGAGATAKHGPTELIEPTARLGATEKTVLAPGDRVTERTLPAAAARPTERTLPARALRPRTGPREEPKAPARPRRKRRRLLWAAVAVLVLAALGVAATQLVPPKYAIQWTTVRSDPLDTPNGIHVSVCPQFAGGRFWWPIGTIGDEAPPDWGNWTTWLGTIDVKFSDGLYREFVLTCGPSESGGDVGFGGVTFEELAGAREAKVVEDLSRAEDYILAILRPERLAKARGVADLRRCLSRVDGLLSQDERITLEGTQAGILHQAATHIVAATDALKQGDTPEARSRLSRAEAAIEKASPGQLAELPDDFLYRQTTRRAILEALGVSADLARLGDPKAMLASKNLAQAKSLAEVSALLKEVAELASRTKDAELDKQRLASCRGAVTALAAAADTLADGDHAKASKHLDEAEAAIQNIDLADLPEPPNDFLFHRTLRDAVAEVQTRGDKARSVVTQLEPSVDLGTSLAFAFTNCRHADAALAGYLQWAPGRSAYRKIRDQAKEDSGDLERLLQGLGEAVPPPIAVARRYLAKLDELLQHTPAPDAEPSRFRAGVLELADQTLTQALQAKRAPWLAKCYANDEAAFLDQAERFWQEAHRGRFEKAASQCLKFASDRFAKAAAVPDSPERLAEAKAILEQAKACLDAIVAAANSTQKDQAAAKELLGACSVRYALCLFRLGPAAAEDEDAHLTKVLTLLDKALAELPQRDPVLAKQARVLADLLPRLRQASQKLGVCRRENFAARDTYGGAPRTLFEALTACETVATEMAKHTDHPCHRAALRPFARLSAACCRDFALQNAAACWLLATAAQGCEQGKYGAAADLLQHFLLSPGKGARITESPLKRLLPKEMTDKAQRLFRVAAAFDETKAPAAPRREDERWRKLWDKRLAAKPLLEIEIPQRITPEAMPKAYQGQEGQWTAIYTFMRTLRDHFAARLQAEENLRRLETDATKLWTRTPEGVRANPAAGPAALRKLSDALEQFKTGGRYRPIDDHRARTVAMSQGIHTLQNSVVGLAKRIEALLEGSNPKAAMDALAISKAALGKAAELSLTRKGLTIWIDLALKDADAERFDAAIAKFDAIEQHEQIRKFKDDAAIQPDLKEMAKAVHYCKGQGLLAKGPASFAAALAEFRQAAVYLDAQSVAKQIPVFQDAAKLTATAPFEAWSKLSQILKSQELTPAIRRAAEAAARQTQTTLIADASACTKAFNAALVKGGWEQFLDKGAILDQERANLTTFLQAVEGLEIHQTEDPKQGKLLPGRSEVELTRTRTLKFSYKLPGAAKLPMAIGQSLNWTVRRLATAGPGGRRWVITAWAEAD